MSTDRRKALVEVYPGAKADIDRMVKAAGGWRCEEHPDKPWPHDDCPGPGFIEDPDDS